jgi:predicted enzyme related to lactoylglutathione lyase
MATSFIWYELMTSDPQAAKAFYSAVIGWEAKAFEAGGDYTIVEASGRGVGGLMSIPEDARRAGAHPAWFEDQPPVPEMTSGHVAWHELHTSDWEAAFDFYSRQFGWDKAEAMDMGPMGTYQIFSTEGPNWKGAMFNSNTFGRPAWLYYFVVGDIDEAVERVRSAGGEVIEGPMEVPGSAWVIQGRDPQGAVFALVGRRG